MPVAPVPRWCYAPEKMGETMQNTTIADSQDLVLVGGGHTHALALSSWARAPLPGARVTLIDPTPMTAYSGMLPGFVAGHYPLSALQIDLVALARRAGARYVAGGVDGIDPESRTVHVQGHANIAFDVASIDIGITSAMKTIPGFAAHAVPAKPLGQFAAAWESYLREPGAGRVAVIGGGIAGVELALAAARALQDRTGTATVTIIERAKILRAVRPSTARRLRAALHAHGVSLREHAGIAEITKHAIRFDSGPDLDVDFVIGAAGAVPHDWFAASSLTNDAGFMPVGPTLQSRYPHIFGAGDCVALQPHPRPKAGVYAVRQAPVLVHNLRATLSGTGGLKRYRPQKDYLKLVSMGGQVALGERFGLVFEGAWVWSWKDRIDRQFMARFDPVKPGPRPTLPWPRAKASGELSLPLCGGCGAKLGAPALASGLGDTVPAAGDDAALLQTGGARQVISTDHLRGFVHDPTLVAEIAAVHALGDIWAMGATPQAATASLILPRQSETLAQRSLKEIMETARGVFAAAGAELVGGHTTQGAELTIGFTVTGLCDGEPIRQSGARPGDSLILAKPIGTGVILAGHMSGLAKGDEVMGAVATMRRGQGAAARILRNANAMTDITGFGLAGHLAALCRQSGVGASVELDAIPLLPGAERLSQAGVRSSLYRENRRALPDAATSARHALLFDPQTGGGLLAALPGDGRAAAQALQEAGFEAAVIGQITEPDGHVSIV